MKHNTSFGIDLAKQSIQVTELTAGNVVKRNKAMSPNKLRNLLRTHEPTQFVFEACASSHYWARLATHLDHKAIIVA